MRNNYWLVTRGTWSDRLIKLALDIEKTGWTVKFGRLPRDGWVGCINYDTKIITIDETKARDAFLTLCHEDGHRQAFMYWAATSEDDFERLCPKRDFREHQALVFGWRTCQRYALGRVSLKQWIKEHLR